VCAVACVAVIAAVMASREVTAWHPVVTLEKQIDPAQDFAWAAGQRAAQGGAAAAAEG
jgi:hypothetical protein